MAGDGFCSVFFSALANRLRVRILQELSVKPMSVNELTSNIGAERTLISHNLAMLTKAELVSPMKVGKTRVYSVNEYVVPYVFFLLDRVVCSRCSIRRTCKVLNDREIPLPPSRVKPPCEGCR